jgi:hypothetical protein
MDNDDDVASIIRQALPPPKPPPARPLLRDMEFPPLKEWCWGDPPGEGAGGARVGVVEPDAGGVRAGVVAVPPGVVVPARTSLTDLPWM